MSARKQNSRKARQDAVNVKIGRILHHARIDKHYSLTDLHRITKIKLSYLKAIDSGEFGKVPEGFYLRAFIKKFADTVGINGTELLKRYNNELPDLQDPHYMNKVSEDKLLIRAGKQRVENRHSTVRKYIPLVVMILIVFIVLIGIWVVAAHHHSGFTSSYNDHSTSMSGESSIKRINHKKHHSGKSQVKIKRGAKKGNNVIYHVSSKVRPLSVTFSSSAQIQLKINDGKKVIKQFKLKPGHDKLVKISKRDKSIQLNVDPRDKITMKIKHHVKRLNAKHSAQSIIFKFSK